MDTEIAKKNKNTQLVFHFEHFSRSTAS